MEAVSRPPTTTTRGIGWPSAQPLHRRTSSRPSSRALRRAVSEELTPRQRRGVHRSGAEGRTDGRRGRAAAIDPRRGLQGVTTHERSLATPRARRASRTGGKDMSKGDPLTRLLGTPGQGRRVRRSPGAARYVEGELEGRNVCALLPAVAEHLRNCPACAQDYEGSPRSSASDATARSRATDRLGSVTTHAVRSAGAGEGRCSPGHRCCRGRAVFERSTRSTTHLPDSRRYALMSGECRSSPADARAGAVSSTLWSEDGEGVSAGNRDGAFVEQSGRNRWQPVANGTPRQRLKRAKTAPRVATVRMVRRGSTVRVRQRAWLNRAVHADRASTQIS